MTDFEREKKRISEFLIRNRLIIVIILHLTQVAIADYLAFLLRFETISPSAFNSTFITYLPILMTIRFAFYLQSGLYKDFWRYASIGDLMKIFRSATLGSIAFIIIVRYIVGDQNYPRSIYILDWLLFIIISGTGRLMVRMFREYVYSESLPKRVLIIGAGDTGEKLTRDMNNNPHFSLKPIGFLDDDPHKKGLTIHGFPIFGSVNMLPEVIEKHKPDEVLIALPLVSHNRVKELYELCKPYNMPIKKLPGLSDMLSGKISVAAKLGNLLLEANLVTKPQLQEALDLQKYEGGRLGSKLIKLGFIDEKALASLLSKQFSLSHVMPLSLEDLLQREPVKTNIKSVKDFLEGKSVMVTGAGGSIGSEICRQTLEYCPSHIVLLDRYENGLFDIDCELRGGGKRCSSNITTAVGDVQDKSFLNHLFMKCKPQIIFHAAAHKHVPLMELNPIEAVKNNIFGTKNLLDAAVGHSSETFVMISTDKAVNPTSIMGATKRIAEFLTSSINSFSSTRCTTVRFGNVLGSNGSVIPLFTEQLEKGGPITVTHPDIRRFFMLIPEAVQLVLLTASSGKGGEIFVLDMGEPIKIVSLAENLIRLSGFIPHKEIQIEFTGLRPGEKLYEDLFDESETEVPTFHEKLKIANSKAPSISTLTNHLAELERNIKNYSQEGVVKEIQRMVPGFTARPGLGTPSDSANPWTIQPIR